ncbi:hypothetical protein F9288_17240 [Sphingomonas sp. CL5.1]|uniref:hypothetical protein n=1 Tax=Sphingomonas sp. CL5.1 TaxID=2653203 RepID=UPI001583D1AC|nr:hypothetical protein [Sphingomonas sp. CL5.1]QKS01177.1 hypothetical protein F9288_17240 [Sphingomonas sp. CL5.1]
MRNSTDHPNAADAADPSARFAAEAARFREVLATGRSAVFLRLFDFLVARSGDERAPKEVEVALAIFGKDGARDALQDSAVRVYMHRLRKRLDDFYAGRAGPRLEILKGEYRLVLIPLDDAPEPETGWAWRPTPRVRAVGLWLGVFAAILLLNGAAWFLLARSAAQPPPASATDSGALWRPMRGDPPPLIVVGDAYVLAETDNQRDIRRLVLDPAIQSRDALGAYLRTHPTAFLRYYDLDLHYAPIGTAMAAWTIIPIVRDLHPGSPEEPQLRSSSRLTTQDLEADDIVYVGQLANLGLLAPPLARASGFRLEPDARTLRDVSTGTGYALDVGAGRDEPSRLDYGYIASFAGPSGHHVVLIAGLGDLGVQRMATLVKDRAVMDRLVASAGPSFEALYEVRAMGGAVLDTRQVALRPLHTAMMWDDRSLEGKPPG